MPEQNDRHTGTIKWFSAQRGYGFISQDDGPEVFVAYRRGERRVPEDVRRELAAFMRRQSSSLESAADELEEGTQAKDLA